MSDPTRADDELLLRMLRAYENGFTTRQIADAAGKNVATFRTALHLIRRDDKASGGGPDALFSGHSRSPSKPISAKNRLGLERYLRGAEATDHGNEVMSC